MGSRWKMNSLIFPLVLSLTIGVLIGYYFGQTMNNPLLDVTNFDVGCSQNKPLTLRSHVDIINLNTKIVNNFTCIKSKMLFDLFQTSICLHDVSKDIYVSGSIAQNKIWEENLVTKILRILLKNPEYAMIDIGANIGIYTMYSLSIRRRTISVECYQPNIERIVRAVQLENVSKYVTLIGNAIYTQSGKYLRLAKDESNVGGQGLVTNETTKQSSAISDEFTVSTIRFDDLLPIFIGHKIESAIMKVDIQSSESFLCESGSEIFDSINIVLVQMEWADIKWKQDQVELVIQFFTKRNYLPTATNNCQILNITTSNYTTWGTPYDIYWIKSTHLHICKT